MTTKEEQEIHTTDAPVEDRRPDRSSSTTQVGQVIRGLGSKLTQRFSNVNTPSKSPRPSKKPHHSAPTQEQIASLILALGDPDHPGHAGAMDAIVEIGAPAVPLLMETLKIQQPWLPAYRAAEALGRIGDGRATGRLIQALRHSNSNVRWSAVRALAQVGDLRAVFELRRMVQEDHGRTSWGESVAGAAQSALDQLHSQSVLNQSLELVKTAVTSILMILSLILAYSVVTALRNELQQVGRGIPGERFIEGMRGNAAPQEVAFPSPSPLVSPVPPAENFADLLPEPTTELPPTATPIPVPEPVVESIEITGTVLSSANIRPSPSVRNRPIGVVKQGTKFFFIGISPDGTWYHIRLDDRFEDGSYIDNPDGTETGWIHKGLVSDPNGDLQIVETEETDALPDESSDEEVPPSDDTIEGTDEAPEEAPDEEAPPSDDEGV